MSEQMKEVGIKAFIENGAVSPEHFYLKDTARPQAAPAGGVLLKVLAVSVDPYMRGRMRDVKGYLVPPFVPGTAIESGVVARVEQSDSPAFSAGELVSGLLLPWQEYVALPAERLKDLTKNNNPHNFPVSYFLSLLGMPGFTAWSSLKRIAEPKAGETAFVSGAAGAVGLLVGQLLKTVYGCKVVGSAGSDDKVEFLTKEAGFDAAFNYKTTSVAEGLAQHCPNGIDIYFDNVGAETLEAALDACNLHARVVACGAISQYDSTGDQRYGVKNLFQIVTKRIKMEGFIVFDWYADTDLVAQFVREVSDLVASKQIKVVEHLTQGIENAGAAFCDMMAGRNLGKASVLFE